MGSDQFTRAEMEAGRKLFAGDWQFVAAAGSPASLPVMKGVEIAFAGRSNVGKSSLINALTGRKNLARISRTPGRTQELIFFNGGDRLNVVDMPGYGYAEAALQYWSGRGLPPDKMVLGVPFYARPGELTYRQLVGYDPAAPNSDELDYYHNKVYYNGIPTLQRKTRLARERASGIMIWALPQDTFDDTSLLKAIYQAAMQPPLATPAATATP